MDNRSFLSGAAVSAPTAPSSPSAGYPTGGNPATATPPTNPGPYWFHQIGEELRAVIVAGGLTPSAGTLTQLLSALQALFGTVLTTSGIPDYLKVGGIIFMWGENAVDRLQAAGALNVAFPHGGFPTACLSVMLTARNPTSDATADTWPELVGKSPTSFDVFPQTASAGSGPMHGFLWLAIGW